MPSNSSSSKQKQKRKFPIQQFSTAMVHLNMPDGQVQAEKLLGHTWLGVKPGARASGTGSRACQSKPPRSKNSVKVVVVFLSFPCPVSVETTLPGAAMEQISSAYFSCLWGLTAPVLFVWELPYLGSISILKETNYFYHLLLILLSYLSTLTGRYTLVRELETEKGNLGKGTVRYSQTAYSEQQS